MDTTPPTDADENTAALAAVKPMRVWDRAIVAPALWALSGIGVLLFCNPFTQLEDRGTISRLMQTTLIGALIDLFVQCAIWAAWAPQSFKWRGAFSISTAALLAVLASMRHGELMGPVLLLGLFLVFWFVLSGVRSWTGISLQLDSQIRPANRYGVGVGYLLGWTAAVAILIAAASEVPWRSVYFPGGYGYRFLVDLAWIVTAFVLVLTNTALGFAVVVEKPSGTLLGALGWPLFAAITGVGVALAVAGITYRVLLMLSNYLTDLLVAGVGATASALLFGLVIRFGGYRLAKEAAA